MVAPVAIFLDPPKKWTPGPQNFIPLNTPRHLKWGSKIFSCNNRSPHISSLMCLLFCEDQLYVVALCNVWFFNVGV